jgi:organic radical activating enzyme
MSAEDIRVKCQEVGASCQDIVFTGGEPGLQLDVELMYELRSYRTAIETNGTTDVSKLGLDWITVSPKVVYPIIQFAANEVKYVMPVGRPLPEATVKARYKLLSPCFQGKDVDPLSLSWCIDLVKKNPEWRLSFQQHKLWGIQ